MPMRSARRPAGSGSISRCAERGDAVIGIRNGIDTARWDPTTDERLAATYDPRGRTVAAGRAANRAAVLDQLGWPDDGIPLAVMVTRLADQKGVDLVAPVVPVLRHVPMRIAVLGVGEAPLARLLAGLAADHPGWLAFVESFDETLAHRMFAGGDVFLMPSRFEPCGLAQMQAMRYGAIPVVTPVGGLVDTVPDIDVTPDGNGIVADAVSSVGVLSALFRAARLLADRRRRAPLVQRITALDWSWTDPATRYVAEYERVVAARISRSVSPPRSTTT